MNKFWPTKRRDDLCLCFCLYPSSTVLPFYADPSKVWHCLLNTQITARPFYLMYYCFFISRNVNVNQRSLSIFRFRFFLQTSIFVKVFNVNLFFSWMRISKKEMKYMKRSKIKGNDAFVSIVCLIFLFAVFSRKRTVHGWHWMCESSIFETTD